MKPYFSNFFQENNEAYTRFLSHQKQSKTPKRSYIASRIITWKLCPYSVLILVIPLLNSFM